MLRNDHSSISTGKYEFVWGDPSKMQFLRIFEAKFELSPEVKIDAK